MQDAGGGGGTLTVNTETSDVTLTSGESGEVFTLDDSLTASLPTASAGLHYYLIRPSSAAGNVVIDAAAGDVITVNSDINISQNTVYWKSSSGAGNIHIVAIDDTEWVMSLSRETLISSSAGP